MKEVAKVIETSDYSLFKFIDANRSINRAHVKKLKTSFQKMYLLSPIIVNENYEIIDGQNRFTTAKELGLPIYFIKCDGYGTKAMQLYNTTMKMWGKEDFLKHYCDLASPEYLKFRNFMRKFPDFSLMSAETILTNSLSGGHKSGISSELKSETNQRGYFTIRYFQEGDLVIPDYDKAVDNAKKILMIKPYYSGFNRSTFVRAMIGIFRIENYSHDQFIKKLSDNQTMMKHCANVGQYKLLIEEIYNYRSREKISLRF
jgi:hypothetical protein